MAFQLEVIRFRDILRVNTVPRFVPGLDPLTLEITGHDLSSASKVLINETLSPEFMITNKQTIFAQLPDGITSVSTIEILSNDFTRTVEASKLEFEVGDKTQKVEGVLKLVQLFTKWILQTPGTDIFNPARGGGLQEIIGKITTTKDMQRILASITRAIGVTVTQIRSAQINVPELPLDERLLSANLIGMNIYQEQMQARARIRLLSVAGAEATAGLFL